MPKDGKRFRNLCFTDFDTSDIHAMAWHTYAKASYIVFGFETCPVTNKPHLQGYAELTDKIAMTTLKKFAPMAHFEERRGSAKDASNYCKKEGNVVERGEMKQAGKRTDIQRVKDKLYAGKSMADIIDGATSFQSVQCAIKIIPFIEKKRDWVPEVRWYYGPSGAGKTRRAVEEAVALYGRYHMQKGASKWWQGYDAHEAVIIDELRTGSALNFVELLALLDRYPHAIECKGGSRQFLAKHVWITSPYDPRTMYHREPEEVHQLLRRITTIIQLSVPEVNSLQSRPEVNRPEVRGNTSPDPWAPPIANLSSSTCILRPQFDPNRFNDYL